MKASRVAGLATGAGVAGIAAWSAVTWARYGHTHPERRPDPLLDRFIPHPEVDEFHHLEVDAPASITFDVAKKMDLQASALITGIFWLRSIPNLIQGKPPEPRVARGIIDETLGLGFGVLAEEPGHAVVIGAYTQPWHEDVVFHSLPPDRFASFDEPGYVKIAVTFEAEPLGPNRSRFVTRTRVVATDPESRRKFRLYWAPMSSGIILIRYFSLPMVKREAERLARQAA